MAEMTIEERLLDLQEQIGELTDRLDAQEEQLETCINQNIELGDRIADLSSDLTTLQDRVEDLDVAVDAT